MTTPQTPQPKASQFSKAVTQRIEDSRETEIDKENAVTDVSHGVQLPHGIEAAPASSLASDSVELELFMQEVVEVSFAEPNDENEPQFFEANVNGHYICIPRDGEPRPMKRYHLEVAARSKVGRMRQKKVVNDDGSMGYIDQMVWGQMYPFQVVGDSRKGTEWLRQQLKRQG